MLALLMVLPAASGLASAQSLINGGVVTGSISFPGDVDTYAFGVNAGEGVQLRVADLSGTGLFLKMSLFDPNGAFVASGRGQVVGAINFTAALGGTYSIVIADDSSATPNETGAYNVYFTGAPGANEGGTLPNGGVAAGAIAVGDLDSFTFAINAGESYQLRVADLSATGFFPKMTLYDPVGAFVTSGRGQTVGAITAVAASTGIYTLVIADDSSSTPQETGSYNIHLVRVPGANDGGTLVNGGAVTDTIDLGDLDTFLFTINAGERYQLRVADLSGTGFFPKMTVYDPIGAFVTSGRGQNVGAINAVAVSTGTYTLVVGDDSSSTPQETGGYNVYYTRVPGVNEGGALINGGLVSDTIDLGDLDSFTFAINAGQSYQLRVVDLSGTGFFPKMTVYDPIGGFVTSGRGQNVGAINAVAVSTGTYTLIVADDSSATPQETGDYNVYFARLPGANDGGGLVNGGSVAGVIDLGDLDAYTFDINAGESYQLRIADLSGTGFFPKMTVYDPIGKFVTSGRGQNVGAINTSAASTGTYTVLVGDDSSSTPQETGAYEVHFVRVPGANEGGLLLDGVLVLDVIDLGDLDSFSFIASAGEMSQITVTDTSGTGLRPRVSLYCPIGRFLTAASGASSAVINHTIVNGGVYTLVVGDDSSSTPQETGSYSIVVSGSAANPVQPANVLTPAGLPTDPILLDIGGNAGIGPQIGNASEPFNFAIDCTGAQAPGVYLISVWSNELAVPVATKWGPLYLTGFKLFERIASHNQSVENWFPAGGGLVVPNDTTLVGLSFTAQGFCGNYSPGGRLSNAITQTVGF